MITLLRRDFTVDRPIEKAWQHLACVEQWPSWAKHIRQVQVQPPGELGPTSRGLIHLTNGLKSAFTMTEFNPYRNWKWVGGFLWLTVHYDHRFEDMNSTRTRLTWLVEVRGFGLSIFGRLFAKFYNKNLDRAIPLLVEEMNTGRV
jgi:uncharacterized membrane protein